MLKLVALFVGGLRSMRSKAILIVDDEFSVRDSLRLWFGKQGYRTEAA